MALCFLLVLIAFIHATKSSNDRWGNEEREAILYGFENLNWDPFEDSGPKINKLLKDLPTKQKALIKPHFSVNDGGTKTNNNTLYEHFKKIGCEFIVARRAQGFRRADGAFGCVVCFVVNFRDLMTNCCSPLSSAFHS